SGRRAFSRHRRHAGRRTDGRLAHAQAGVRPAYRAMPRPARRGRTHVSGALSGRDGRGGGDVAGVTGDPAVGGLAADSAGDHAGAPASAGDAPLAGFTVAITADRRRDEFAALLERRGARVYLAPALRIVPIADD